MTGAAPHPAAGRRRPAAAIAALAAGTFAVGTDGFVIAGFLPQIAADLDVSVALVGQSLTVFALTYAVLAPVLAAVTATMPRRRLLVLALVVLGLADVLFAFAPSLGVVFAARVVAASGSAMFTPIAGAVAADLVPHRYRGRALATVITGLTVATAIGVPAGAFVAHEFGWRVAVGLVAALCGLVAGAVTLAVPNLPGGARVRLRARLGVVRLPAVQAILALTVLGLGASYTVYVYAVPAFGALGVAVADTQFMLFAYGVGAVVGAQLSGLFTDRVSGARVLLVVYTMLALVLLVAGILATGEQRPTALVVVLATAWGAVSWSQSPPQQSRLIEVAPEDAAIVLSLNASCIYLGIGLGTFVGGLFVTHLPAGMFFSGTALAAISIIVLLATRRVVGGSAHAKPSR